VPFHQNAEVHLALHTARTSHTAGVSSIVGSSNTATATNTASESNTSGANTPTTAMTHMDANAIPGTSVGININLGANKSASTIQPPGTTFPSTPCANLRMLELKSNIQGLTTVPGSPIAQLPVSVSNNILLLGRKQSCIKNGRNVEDTFQVAGRSD
jgi:hypothetical protein